MSCWQRRWCHNMTFWWNHGDPVCTIAPVKENWLSTLSIPVTLPLFNRIPRQLKRIEVSRCWWCQLIWEHSCHGERWARIENGCRNFRVEVVVDHNRNSHICMKMTFPRSPTIVFISFDCPHITSSLCRCWHQFNLTSSRMAKTLFSSNQWKSVIRRNSLCTPCHLSFSYISKTFPLLQHCFSFVSPYPGWTLKSLQQSLFSCTA